MANRLSWFLTPTGKKFSLGFMTTASIAAFSCQYFPHSFLLYKYKEIVSMYNLAIPVPLHERLKKRWDDTLGDLSLPDWEIKFIEPFTVFGFDLFHAGTTAHRKGAIIGLPINYTYQNPENVNPTGILINNETVNWNRQDAKNLLDALVLSEDAQRYGIAREIMMSRDQTPLLMSTLGAFMVSSTYLLCRGMNQKLNLYERPLPIRGFFYALGAIFSFGIWAAQKDLYNIYRENETDQHLAQLGPRYVKGAIEFYDKMLKKNIALRSLMGTKGEDVYTPSGNEKYFFRQPRIPIDQRKQFFEDRLKEIRQKSEILDEEEAIPQPA